MIRGGIIMERILCVLIGYICGLFQTSYLYGKLLLIL